MVIFNSWPVVRVRDRDADGTVLVEPPEADSFRARAPREPLAGPAEP